MSGTGAQHLERRHGIFGLRVRVPDDIRPLVGMVEVRRSLRTYEPFRARVQSAVYAARLFKVFEMVRNEKATLGPDAVKAMIAACLREMVIDAINCTLPSFTSAASDAPDSIVHAPRHFGPTVAEAVDVYLDAKKATWTLKTYESRRRKLSYLKQHLGENTFLQTVTPGDVRAFRDGVSRLRRNQGRCRAESFLAKQTDSLEHRIDAKTATLIFEPTKAFFRWSKSEQGYIASNPAEDIRLSMPKRSKSKKSRRPFTANELTQLFSAPLFTGTPPLSDRLDRGGAGRRDAKYWVPILAYYTGARLGELVQLHLADVGNENDIWFLRITDETSGAGGPCDVKHVKTLAGIRQIPLHPDLIAIGFLEFVRARRRLLRGGTRRLFPEIKFGADGQASTVFSKWFGRFMTKAGLDDPALVFHSFRHNAEDALRDALQPQYVIDKVIGHTDPATSAIYGDGASLETLNAAVHAMRMKVRLPDIFSMSAGKAGK